MRPGRTRGRRLNRLLRWGGLAVCVVVAGVWGVSEWRDIRLYLFSSRLDASRGKREQTVYVLCRPGGLAVSAFDHPWNDGSRMYVSEPTPDKPRNLKLSGYVQPHFDFGILAPKRQWWFEFDGYDNATLWARTIRVPLWFPLLLTAAPTALAWRSELRRRRRERVGLCAKCGYDLAGLARGGGAACPECGTARVA